MLSDRRREFARAAMEVDRLAFLLAAEEGAGSSGDCHDAVASMWMARRAGLQFRKDHPDGDAEQAWEAEVGRMREAVEVLCGGDAITAAELPPFDPT